MTQTDRQIANHGSATSADWEAKIALMLQLFTGKVQTKQHTTVVIYNIYSKKDIFIAY